MDDRVDFVGLSLVADPPVGHMHLQLKPGLTALYGENGVGKSRILTAVAELLNGLGASPDRSAANEQEYSVLSEPTSLIEVAYRRGGLHLRRPLRPGATKHTGWTPQFVREIEGYTEQEFAESAAGGFLPERWRRLVQSVRTELPWADATDGEAEYLLRHGRWLVVPDSAMTCLCDPSPREGPLAQRWAASNELWTAHLKAADQQHPASCLREHGSKEVAWYPSGGCSTPYWSNSWQHPEPPLPPTPDVLGLPDWPEWTGFPVILGPFPGDPAARGVRPPVVRPPVTESGDPAIEHTVRRIASLRGRPDGTWVPTDALDRIVADANDVLAAMFGKRLVLTASVRSLRDWFRGDAPVQWFATVDGRPPIELSRLGSAHARFASFAIQCATSEGFEQPPPAQHPRPGSRPERRLSTAVIDEPERALHQAAIVGVADGLSALAEYVVVASHAPEVLSGADSRLHVTIDKFGFSQVESPRAALSLDSLVDEAARLGVTPDRAAAIADVILLVEGQHDVEVLRRFLEPELNRHLLLFVALGGTEGLGSVAEATYLFSTSNAPIVVCLDSLDTEVADNLTAIKSAHGQAARRSLLATMRGTPRYQHQREMKALLALMAAATDQDRLDRLHVHAFTKPDIVRYIDADLVSERPGSWEDLESQFLRDTGRTTWRAGDGARFKEWIGPKYRILGVRRAAQEQVQRWTRDLGVEAHRHIDFGRLGALLDQLRS